MFGDNILATDATGTEASVKTITIDDLKEYYSKYLSPSIARFLVVGDVDVARVKKALTDLNLKWKPKNVGIPEIKVPGPPEKSQIYFVDVPGAKQSVISIGAPSVSYTHLTLPTKRI